MKDVRRWTAVAAKRVPLVPLLFCWSLASCGTTLVPEPFEAPRSTLQVHSTSRSVAPGGVHVVSGPWVAYLALEATTGGSGTDLNGDGDVDDSVATVVNMWDASETVLGVAARDLAILGQHVYTAADERDDSFDWSGDGSTDDLVLLHWSRAAARLSFVSTLRRGDTRMLISDERLYFSKSSEEPTPPGETSIAFVSPANPTTAMPVFSTRASAARSFELLAEDEGLLFLVADEGANQRDLNADGDLGDGVLALLDSTDAAAPVQSVGLALSPSSRPVRALRTESGDWVVAFLVNEAAQGNTNLNDPALFGPLWQPVACVSMEDDDALDDVLHYLEFRSWSNDPVAHSPTNTGLVGRDRILAVNRSTPFVGTISAEVDEGSCSLNGDLDHADRVFRWLKVEPPFVRPVTEPDLLTALYDVPGGSRGVVEFEDRWMAVLSEEQDERDYDADPDRDWNLLAWIDPGAGPTADWIVRQRGDSGPFYLALSWMAPFPSDGRLPIASLEARSSGVRNDTDDDSDDSVLLSMYFDAADPTDLDGDGYLVAVDSGNVGAVFAGDELFYRLDEHEDNLDWNGDGDVQDQVLVHQTHEGEFGGLLGTLNGLQAPAITTDGDVGVVFVSDEAMARRDYNQDGDEDDLVLRYARIR